MTGALTIGGCDSSGGAGIHVDLRVFASCGIAGSAVLTALTAQNTVEMRTVRRLGVAEITAQLDQVLEVMRPSALKTAMLGSGDTVRALANRRAAGVLPTLVVDPVLVDRRGRRLFDDECVAAYVDQLLPVAAVVTPNAAEAALLVGLTLPETTADLIRLARLLGSACPGVVVVKGGRLRTDPVVDVVWDGTRITTIEGPRVATRNVRGTGDAFSATVAAGLASGVPVGAALTEAKALVSTAIAGAAQWRVGAGPGPIAVGPPLHGGRWFAR